MRVLGQKYVVKWYVYSCYTSVYYEDTSKLTASVWEQGAEENLRKEKLGWITEKRSRF